MSIELIAVFLLLYCEFNYLIYFVCVGFGVPADFFNIYLLCTIVLKKKTSVPPSPSTNYLEVNNRQRQTLLIVNHFLILRIRNYNVILYGKFDTYDK